MVYGEDRIAASVLVRVTYRLRDGALVPDDSQPWLVSNAPWDGPQGPMASDLVFYKGGVDIFLFASAVPPDGAPATSVPVEISVGTAFKCRVLAFGPRVWQRRLGRLMPSAPAAFTSLPLALEHAFGGQDDWDGLAIPYPDNPEGTGFYLTERSAIDRPLPRIEDASQLIAHWDDRPAPVGMRPCSPGSPLRGKHGTVIQPDGRLKIRPHFFNDAFPAMIAPHAQPGDPVTIVGVSAAGPVCFRLPHHPVRVHLRFGSEAYSTHPVIDQVGIEIAEQRVFVAYRYAFRYVIHELQHRSCELLEGSQ